jgi:predicted aminopeptidase
MRGDQIANAETAAVIAESREADERDRVAKTSLCALLRYDTAALANEGFAVYAPERSRLEAALRTAKQAAAVFDDLEPRSPHLWRFITNRSTTLATLRSIGANAGYVRQSLGEAQTPAYSGFFEDDIPPAVAFRYDSSV